MVATKLLTVEEFAGIAPRGGRAELIDGEVREMSPAHGQHVYVNGRIALALYTQMAKQDQMFVGIGEGGYIVRRNPDSVLVPDLTVLLGDQVEQLAKTGHSFVDFAPAIAIEVKSQSDREVDIARKLATYLEAGVREVWWVRPDDRQVTIHRPDRTPEVISVTGFIESAELLPGFKLALTDIFEP